MTVEDSGSSRPNWFSIKEAAEYLEVGEPTLYRWMREGQITFRKVGDSTRFLQEDLDAAVQVHRSKRELERAKGICPVCRGEDLADGFVQSTGRIYFKLKDAKFWTLKENVVPTTARLCRKCGAITCFGDLEKLDALIEKQDSSGEQ